jgi:predicted nucleotidyltransferase
MPGTSPGSVPLLVGEEAFEPVIPPFLPDGLLPDGCYECDLVELANALGFSDRRKEILNQFERLLDSLPNREAVDAIYLNGSFAETKPNPADLDVFLVVKDLVHGGPSVNVLRYVAERQLTIQRLWHLDVVVGDREFFEDGWRYLYSHTRADRPKGFIQLKFAPIQDL